MKKLIAIIFCSLLLILSPLPVLAQRFDQGKESVTLSQDEVVNSDYFAVGKVVTISGTINGDVYVAGGTVIIDGTVNGDVLAAGGNVTIKGTVSDDVRAAGGNVTIAGIVGKNVTLATGNGVIDSSARIAGSVTGGAGQLSILGPVGKNAVIGGGTVVVGNVISGNLTTGTGNLTLNNKAKIGGNLSYSSQEHATFDKGSSISGQVTKYEPPTPHRKAEPQKIFGIITAGKLIWELITFVIVYALGALFILAFPNFMKMTTEVVLTKSLASLGIGFLIFIGLPFIALLLLVTLIGIPFSILLIFAYIVYLFVAKLFISLAIGEKVFNLQSLKTKKTRSQYLLLFVGLLIYKVVTLLPLIGWLIGFVATLIGMGALATQKRTSYLLLRKRGEL